MKEKKPRLPAIAVEDLVPHRVRAALQILFPYTERLPILKMTLRSEPLGTTSWQKAKTQRFTLIADLPNPSFREE